MRDLQLLKGSLQHAVTQQQVIQILTNMALIQQVYLSPDGVPEEAILKEETD